MSEKQESYLHTYEFTCRCGGEMNSNLSKQIDETPICHFCGELMVMSFYLRSPDTRAENNEISN